MDNPSLLFYYRRFNVSLQPGKCAGWGVLGKLIDLEDKSIVNPVDIQASDAEKLKQLHQLSLENEPAIKAFLEKVDTKYGTKSATSHKKPEAILEKASRKSIKDVKPWHDVEHIRDSFRFKTVLKDIEDLPKIAEDLKESGFEVIKTDTDKVLVPGPWGWRIAAFDLKMPNGQLVEYYLPVQELEQAKKNGNHKLFEKWRNADMDKLSAKEQLEYLNDLDDSNDRYEQAWSDYCNRTKQNPDRVRALLDKTEAVFEKSKEEGTDSKSNFAATPK